MFSLMHRGLCNFVVIPPENQLFMEKNLKQEASSTTAALTQLASLLDV